jgi:hypothetical protein
MNTFKIVLLSGVLGMTWVDCGRRPEERTHAFPEAAFEAAPTNAMFGPLGAPNSPGQPQRVGAVKTTPDLTLSRP